VGVGQLDFAGCEDVFNQEMLPDAARVERGRFAGADGKALGHVGSVEF
jgi:hypothetical protein